MTTKKQARKQPYNRMLKHCNIKPPEGIKPAPYDCILFGKCNCAVEEVAAAAVAPVIFIGTTGYMHKREGTYQCLVCGTTWSADWLRKRTAYVHSQVPYNVDGARRNKEILDEDVTG